MPDCDTGTVNLFHVDAGIGDPPVLLLHELGGSSESWQAVVARLAGQRRVIAVDLRYAGRSEKPVGGCTFADLVDDVAALLDRLGIARVDVLGAALGSLAGAVLAIRHPGRVAHLAMCAVADDMSGVTADYLRQRAARVRITGMRAVADASLANAFPPRHEAARTAYRPIYLANDPAAYAELSLALAGLSMTAEDWGAITAPALVVSGEHDFIWPPEAGRRVAALIPGARFTVLPDAGHFPHLQRPAALASGVLGFFRGDAGA
jgi:3-oxoadipate enol-lactonase